MNYTIVAYEDIKKTQVAYTITFDAVTSVSESYVNKITELNIEDGSVINDHMIKVNDKITIEGVVTDLSFRQGEDGLVMFNNQGELLVKLTERWSRTIKKALLDINDRMLPCSFKASRKDFGSPTEYIDREVFPCLIESLNLDHTGNDYDCIQPKITFVPIRVATLETLALTDEQKALPALKKETRQTSANSKSGTTGDGSGSDSMGSLPDAKSMDLGNVKNEGLGAEENKALEAVKSKAGVIGTAVKIYAGATEIELNEARQEYSQRVAGR